MENSQTKYVALAKRLEAQVLGMPHRAKLPPMRALTQRYGVSMVTVNSALELLEQKGLVERCHGSGVFVSKEHEARRLAFVISDYLSPISDARLLAMQDVCRAKGWMLSIAQTPHRLSDDFASLEGHFNAIVLHFDAFKENSTFLRTLLQREVPMLVLGSPSGHLNLDSVSGDNYHGMGLLFKHLYERGHRRIGLLVNEPLFPEVIARRAAFEQFAGIFGLEEAPIIDCHTNVGDDSAYSAQSTLRAYLKKHPKPQFTALIAVSDHGGLAALRALYEHGVPLKDCHVTGFDNVFVSSLCIPSLTTLSWNLEEMAERCLEVVENRLQGDTSPVMAEKIKPALIIRESTSGAAS